MTLLITENASVSSAKECRDRSDTKLSRHAENVEHSLHGSIPVTEYRLMTYQGARVDQHSLNGFLFTDGHCIEIKLSMLDYKSKHRALFHQTLDAVRLQQAD